MGLETIVAKGRSGIKAIGVSILYALLSTVLYCILIVPLCSITYIANCTISSDIIDGSMNRSFRIMGGVYDIHVQ